MEICSGRCSCRGIRDNHKIENKKHARRHSQKPNQRFCRDSMCVLEFALEGWSMGGIRWGIWGTENVCVFLIGQRQPRFGIKTMSEKIDPSLSRILPSSTAHFRYCIIEILTLLPALSCLPTLILEWPVLFLLVKVSFKSQQANSSSKGIFCRPETKYRNHPITKNWVTKQGAYSRKRGRTKEKNNNSTSSNKFSRRYRVRGRTFTCCEACLHGSLRQRFLFLGKKGAVGVNQHLLRVCSREDWKGLMPHCWNVCSSIGWRKMRATKDRMRRRQIKQKKQHGSSNW